jgi:hypothetical protein
MNRILVSITLTSAGMATIKASPDLQKGEMEFINQWKAEGLLESFFISTDRTGAYLVFCGIDGDKARALIAILPYFPHMASVEYRELMKQF